MNEGCANRRRIVLVPVVVEPVVVPVPPVAVPIEVTDAQVAVRIAVMCGVPSVSLPLEACVSRGCLRGFRGLRHRNAPALHTKYLHF